MAKKNSEPAVSERIRTYVELQQQIHEALRAQHPEWIDFDGRSSLCDAYDARLAKLLALFASHDDREAA